MDAEISIWCLRVFHTYCLKDCCRPPALIFRVDLQENIYAAQWSEVQKANLFSHFLAC